MYIRIISNSRFLHKIQDVIGEMCFIEIIGSTLILCLLGYYVITVRNSGALIFINILYLYLFNIAFIALSSSNNTF